MARFVETIEDVRQAVTDGMSGAVLLIPFGAQEHEAECGYFGSAHEITTNDLFAALSRSWPMPSKKLCAHLIEAGPGFICKARFTLNMHLHRSAEERLGGIQ